MNKIMRSTENKSVITGVGHNKNKLHCANNPGVTALSQMELQKMKSYVVVESEKAPQTITRNRN